MGIRCGGTSVAISFADEASVGSCLLKQRRYSGTVFDLHHLKCVEWVVEVNEVGLYLVLAMENYSGGWC
jgi:hypothetical protein